MLIVLLVILAILYLAFRTRPSVESFHQFYKDHYMRSDGEPRQKASWFSKLIDKVSGGTGVPPPSVFYDFILGWLVSVQASDKQTWFLGMFGVWLPVVWMKSTGNHRSDGFIPLSNQQGMSAEVTNRAEHLEHEANFLKANQQCRVIRNV